MNVIKMAFYMMIGIGCTWSHMMGHDVLLNWLFFIWLPFGAYTSALGVTKKGPTAATVSP